MKPFLKHTGVVVPLDRANVDTDQIIPKQFLKKVERTGFGKHLFHDWRYLDDTETTPNPDFVLNKPQYTKATILLARDNFGCGSSREHAPWALADYGFAVIIAPSFADIFYNNALKNGLLLIRLAPQEVDVLFNQASGREAITVTADLEKQVLRDAKEKQYRFEIDPFARECLLKGLDVIGMTEQYADEITAYEKNAAAAFPWLR